MCCLASVALVLILALTSDIGHGYRDLTLVEDAKGSDVVKAVIAKFDAQFSTRSSVLWSNRGNFDGSFMRDLAYVESLDGLADGTFSNGYHGGIWKVDESFFQTISLAANVSLIRELYGTINDVFGIDWNTVGWVDLRKPLYSAIAARLYIVANAIRSGNGERCNNAPVPDEHAQYWSLCFRIGAEITLFINRTVHLGNECRVDADVMFVLDSSGSIGAYDWEKVKKFVYNFTSDLILTKKNDRQVGIITFSSGATTNVALTDNKQLLLDDIPNLVFIGGSTATADGLCKLQYQNWREHALRFAIVMTDGQSNTPSPECGNTQQAISIVHSLDPPLLVYVIGVTDNTNPQELNSIASKPEYVNHIDRIEEEALNAVREHQNYHICYTASAPVSIGNQTINRTDFDHGEMARYQYVITEKGVTIRLCILAGRVILYGSTSVPTPNSAYNDFILDPTLLAEIACADVYIDLFVIQASSKPVNNNESNVVTPSPSKSDTLYVSIEGRDTNNSFNLHSIPGDSAESVISCKNNPCGDSEGIVCTDDPVGYSCSCGPGFTGDELKCLDLNECAQNVNPCDVNAQCVNTVGSYTCTDCGFGYAVKGTQCSLHLPTIIGLGIVTLIATLTLVVFASVCLALTACFWRRRKSQRESGFQFRQLANADDHEDDDLWPFSVYKCDKLRDNKV